MKDDNMRAIVDVDNTICDFSSCLHSELIKTHPNMPHPDKWDMWDFYLREGMDKKTFYKAIERAHNRLFETPPLPLAGHMLETLKHLGFKITIASHRDKRNTDMLRRWLDDKKFVYDDIHVSWDKTKEFEDDSVLLIVDDSPSTIESAVSSGVLAYALLLPWNRCMQRRAGVYLGADLGDVTSKIVDRFKA